MAYFTSVLVCSSENRAGRQPGLLPLAELVFGSTIRGGAFSLPQNMAKGASPGAVVIGWLVNGIGILIRALVCRHLAARRQQPHAGLYTRARDGSGDVIGFSSDWRSLLNFWVGNISYAVLIFGAPSYFFWIFGAAGDSWQTVLVAPVSFWVIHGLVVCFTTPAQFSAANRNGSPSRAQWVANISVQPFLQVSPCSNARYLALYGISATAIPLPNVLSGACYTRQALPSSGPVSRMEPATSRRQKPSLQFLSSCLRLLQLSRLGPDKLIHGDDRN